MELAFSFVWGCMGYALKGERFVGELKGQLGQCKVLELWRLGPLCLLWCIWRERNAKSFEHCEMEMLRVK
jgi:hypothetical protein